MTRRTPWDPRDGTLGDLTGGLYWLLALQGGLLLATAPTIIGFVLLERHPSNLLLFAAFAIPVGPAVQAAVYSMRSGPGAEELRPFRRLWEGWRLGLRQSLAVWVPTMVVVGMALTTWAYRDDARIAPFFAVGGLVVAASVVVWAFAALAVVAHFTFLTRDLIRVVMYGLGARPLVPLGLLSLLTLLGLLVALTTDLVVAFLGVLFVYSFTLVIKPTIEVIREVFVSPPE